MARNLAPSDTAALGRDNVLGFAMDEGGTTSHVAILARSLGVPAVVGLGGRATELVPGRAVAIDGNNGEIVLDPDQETRNHYEVLNRQAGGGQREAGLPARPAGGDARRAPGAR